MNWNWSYLYTSFTGRITRSRYWGATILLLIPILIIQLLVIKFFGVTVAAFTSLAFYYPAYAVALKRSNDRNRPQWIVLAIFIYFAAINLLVPFAGSQVPSPTGWQMIVGLINILLGLYLLVDLGCLRGTRGDNQFGPDSLAGTDQQV